MSLIQPLCTEVIEFRLARSDMLEHYLMIIPSYDGSAMILKERDKYCRVMDELRRQALRDGGHWGYDSQQVLREGSNMPNFTDVFDLQEPVGQQKDVPEQQQQMDQA